jgi:hypothetical protein
MLPEAALLFDSPGFVDCARHRPEKPERRPDQANAAGQTDLYPLGSKRIELVGQKIEPGWKVAKEEPEHARPVVFISGHHTKNGDEEKKKREER